MAVIEVEEYKKTEDNQTIADKIKTTYKGCVLDEYEKNYYDDSDFYAIVWDEVEQKIKHIPYRTTRGYTEGNYAEVDATEEVVEKAKAYIHNISYNSEYDRRLKYAVIPEKDKRVSCNIKRGKSKGVFEGVVFWEQLVNSMPIFGTPYEKRLGIKLDNGEVKWVTWKEDFYHYESIVKVIEPQDYFIPPTHEEIRFNGWRSMLP